MIANDSLTRVGKTVVLDSDGKKTIVSNEDPRFLSGELKSIARNKVPVRDYETGESFTTSDDDPRLSTGEIIGVRMPYARITDGVDERPYRLDGTDSIPDGWWVCFKSNGFDFVNVYSNDSDELVERDVAHIIWGLKQGWTQGVAAGLSRTLKRDLSKPHCTNKSPPNHHHIKGFYIKPTEIDLSRATSQPITKKSLNLVDTNTGENVRVYVDDQRLADVGSDGSVFKVNPGLGKGKAVLRNVETGATFMGFTDDEGLETGHVIANSMSYARITNGVDERRYVLDGSDSIPDEWWICSLSGNKFILIDVYDAEYDILEYSGVSASHLFERLGFHENARKALIRTLKRDEPGFGRARSCRGFYAKPSSIDLSRCRFN
jgi:hypothetical protein